LTGRRVLIEVHQRADKQIEALPEVLRVKVRLALLDLIGDPLPLARGAIPFKVEGEEIPGAYEWDIEGVTIFYNLVETGTTLVQVIIQVVLHDAL
jgi:hypothetical protein